MSDRDYCYPPDFTVLRNRLGIRAAPALLEAAERGLVAQRLLEPLPRGDFDLPHLKAIHRHPFRDVNAWAGVVRTVEIAKDGSRFQPRRFIETGMADIRPRIMIAGHFREMGPYGFVEGAGPILGDINHVHPFREVNGRTQLRYLRQLAAHAGHALDVPGIARFAGPDIMPERPSPTEKSGRAGCNHCCRIGESNYAATSGWPSMTTAHRARYLGVLASRSLDAGCLEQL